ncbi:hypothetical protein PPYR_09110 [Photinus pyralis]|uniref:Uncharacterized protein n=1 Tax=Photinus pyralis TaxID=7054 RepID=A0A5N4ALC5_PHOPY|nr:hypothetical protein PPYR_09110 [Photinus pyralis]
MATEMQDQNENQADNPQADKNISTGDYVAVTFLCENNKKTKFFAGEVTNISDNGQEFTINFFRKQTLKGTYFTFPHVQDKQTVAKEDIVSKLCLKRVVRGRFYFSMPDYNLE